MGFITSFKDYELYVFGVAACVLLWVHFRGKYEASIVGLVGLSVALFGALGYEVTFVLERSSSTLVDLALLSFAYAVVLFVALSDFLKCGLASWLTAVRGDAWVKEIDYLYLALGAAGLVLSMNRYPTVTGRLEVSELFGPVVLITALVLRTIKTRAEIAGWNKPEFKSKLRPVMVDD